VQELTLIMKWKKLFFSTKKQAEFLDNYLSLKGGDDDSEPLDDRSVFTGVRDIYEEVVSPTCFEVNICDYVIESLADGGRVDEALGLFLNKDIKLAFKATFEVGKTEFGITQVIKNINKQNELQKSFTKKIRGGLFLFGFGLVFVYGVSVEAMPGMLKGLDASEIDELTQLYMQIGQLINDKTEKVLFIVTFLFVVFKYSQANWSGEIRNQADSGLLKLLYYPYKAFAANRFFNMLTLLKSSGLSLRQSLELIEEDVTPFMQHHLTQMIDMTRVGSSNLEQLDTGLLTPRLKVRLKIAGKRESDSIDEVFSQIAISASDDFEKSLERIGDQLKFWLMTSGLGLIVMSLVVVMNLMMTE